MPILTEKEIQSASANYLLKLEHYLKMDDQGARQMMEQIPSLITINRVDSWDWTYCNDYVTEILNKERHELIETGFDVILERIHPKNYEFQRYFFRSISYDPHHVINYFQCIKKTGEEDYYWITTLKKFLNHDHYLSLHIDLRQLGLMYKVLRRYLGDLFLSIEAYSRFGSLTLREREVLKQVIDGKTNKEIGDYFFISSDTVRTHRNRIWKKLDIRHFRDCLKYEILLSS